MEWLESFFGAVLLALVAVTAGFVLQALLEGVGTAAWGIGRGIRDLLTGLRLATRPVAKRRYRPANPKPTRGKRARGKRGGNAINIPMAAFLGLGFAAVAAGRSVGRKVRRLSVTAGRTVRESSRMVGRKARRATAGAGRAAWRSVRQAGRTVRATARDVWLDMRYDPTRMDAPAWAWSVDDLDDIPQVTAVLAPAEFVRWRWVQGEDRRWRLVIPTEDAPLARALLAEVGWDLPPDRAEPVPFWDDVPWGPYEGEVVEEEEAVGEEGARTHRPPDPSAGGRALYERYGRDYMRMLGRLGAQARWERR